MNNTTAPFNRCVGLAVIEVINSNPNGDPDMESDPRTMDHNGHGLISPVSYKRKFRDLVEDQNGLVFQEASQKLTLSGSQNKREYKILESRGRNRSDIKGMCKDTFQNTYWDARVFGNTFLESLKDNELTDEEKQRKKEGGYAHFIRTGTIQVGVGMSVAPVEIERLTMTNKAGVQEDKDRGMAPMGFRVARHGIYTIPFFVNPAIALKTGADGSCASRSSTISLGRQSLTPFGVATIGRLTSSGCSSIAASNTASETPACNSPSSSAGDFVSRSAARGLKFAAANKASNCGRVQPVSKYSMMTGS